MTNALQLTLPPALTAITHSAMATEWVFHLGGHEPAYLQQAAAEAFRVVDQLEETLSLYRETSEVTRLNRAPAGAEVPVGPDTLACLALAAEAAALTDGAFEAFTGRAALAAKDQPIPLHLADAPGPAAHDQPGPVFDLQAAAGLVRKLRAGPWLDLGALGKGYALDQAAATLAEWDVTTGCLVAGGSSLRGLGGPAWTLTLDQHRFTLPGEFCLGASGFDFHPGHIIDSRPAQSGQPAARAVVLAPTAALADALSTAAILLTESQLAALTRTQPSVASLVFTADGQRQAHGTPFAHPA